MLNAIVHHRPPLAPTQACGQKAALEADAQQQQGAIDAQQAVIDEIQVSIHTNDKIAGRQGLCVSL